jgi:hypothetical protein
MSYVARFQITGDIVIHRTYRLRHLVRYFRRVFGPNFKGRVKPTPVTPWLIHLSIEDALEAAKGKMENVERITINDKVTP